MRNRKRAPVYDGQRAGSINPKQKLKQSHPEQVLSPSRPEQCPNPLGPDEPLRLRNHGRTQRSSPKAQLLASPNEVPSTRLIQQRLELKLLVVVGVSLCNHRGGVGGLIIYRLSTSLGRWNVCPLHNPLAGMNLIIGSISISDMFIAYI